MPAEEEEELKEAERALVLDFKESFHTIVPWPFQHTCTSNN